MAYTAGIHLPVVERLNPIQSGMNTWEYFKLMTSLFWLGNEKILAFNNTYYYPRIYDTTTDSWTIINSANWGLTSTLGSPSNASFAGVYDRSQNKLWVLNYGGTARFYPLDVSTMTWGASTALGSFSPYAGAQVLHTDNSVYTGLDDNAIYVKQGTSYSGFAKYDISANTWTSLASFPTTNGFMAFFPALDTSKIYYFERYMYQYYTYDIATNTWSSVQYINNPPSANTGSFYLVTPIALDMYGTEAVLGVGNTGKYGYAMDGIGNIWRITLNSLTLEPQVEIYRERYLVNNSYYQYPGQILAYVETGSQPFIYWAIGSSSTTPSYYFFRGIIK